MKFDLTLRNLVLNAIEDAIGVSPTLNIYSGAQPTNTTDAATGSLLCSMTLPANWMEDAGGGTKTLLGNWTGTGLAAAGTGTNAGYFRILSGSTVRIQGACTPAAGAGPMKLNNISIAEDQTVTVTTFTLTAPNSGEI